MYDTTGHLLCGGVRSRGVHDAQSLFAWNRNEVVTILETTPLARGSGVLLLPRAVRAHSFDRRRRRGRRVCIRF